MLERFLHREGSLSASWSDLGSGAPTLIALAQLCSQAIAAGRAETTELTLEAQAILYTARTRGIIEVKGSNEAYESSSRLLTVFVEIEDQSQIRFRNPRQARQNIRFIEGFGQLCRSGLVMHHLYHEFSLTSAGFDHAATLSPEAFQELLQWRQPCGGE